MSISSPCIIPKSVHVASSFKSLPGWLSSSESNYEGFTKLSSAAFADRENSRLEIHTKEAAFLSALEVFYQNGSESDSTVQRVKEACQRFGIAEELEFYEEAFATAYSNVEKAAGSAKVSDTPAFAIDTGDVRILPISTPMEAELASEDLYKMAYNNRIPSSMTHVAASAIVAAAGGDAKVHQFTKQAGVHREPVLEDVSKILLQGREAYATDISKYEAIAKSASEEGADPMELVAKIDMEDLAQGIGARRKFAHQLKGGAPTGYDVVFSGPSTEDLLKAASQNIIVRDVMIPGYVRELMDMDRLEFSLSKEASAALKPHLREGRLEDITLVLADLPKDDQDVFMREAVRSDVS